MEYAPLRGELLTKHIIFFSKNVNVKASSNTGATSSFHFDLDSTLNHDYNSLVWRETPMSTCPIAQICIVWVRDSLRAFYSFTFIFICNTRQKRLLGDWIVLCHLCLRANVKLSSSYETFSALLIFQFRHPYPIIPDWESLVWGYTNFGGRCILVVYYVVTKLILIKNWGRFVEHNIDTFVTGQDRWR